MEIDKTIFMPALIFSKEYMNLRKFLFFDAERKR